MKVIIAKDAAEIARRGADLFEQVIQEKPDCTLGLATGSSPIGLYQELIARCKAGKLNFSQVHTINLDEYVGLEGTHPQSYRYFMDSQLFDHINIDKANTFVVKGTGDIAENLKEYNGKLEQTQTDLQLLGVGPDGHLGFNEPGDCLMDEAHEEVLDESTIEANKRFFARKEDVPTKALTMGMGGIMRAKRLVMIASGHKEEAMRRLLLEKTIDPHCPCTFLRLHADATVILEKSLADAIGYQG